MSPDEQKHFCSTVYNVITDISIKCVILDQVIALRNDRRMLSDEANSCDVSDLPYSLNIRYEISSDVSGVSGFISDSVNSEEFKAAAIDNLDMDVCIQSAELASSPTQSPSAPIPSVTPSQSPSHSPNIQISPSPTVLPPSMTPRPNTPNNTPPSNSSVTILMSSSFMWNITCSLQEDEEILLFDALIIEKSILDIIGSRIRGSQSLNYVLVAKVCDRTVPPHDVALNEGRLLQMSNRSDVVFMMEATEKCTRCGNTLAVANALFNNIDTILQEEIRSGNLSNAIKSDSSGRIDAAIELGSTNSTFSIRSDSPSISPTETPTIKPNVEILKTKSPSGKTPKQPSTSNFPTQGTSSKTPKSKVTSSKSSKSSGKGRKAKKGDKKSNSVKKKRVPLSMQGGTLMSDMSHIADSIENESESTSSKSISSFLKISADETDIQIKKARVPLSSDQNKYEVSS